MVKLESVSFAYGENYCLEEISINIKKGECIAIIGPSGTGKTSLIRVINGLIPYYYTGGSFNGRVCISNKDVNELPMWKRGELVGSVFQDPRTQFFSDTVEGEIAFACENFGLSNKDIVNNTDSIIKKINIENLKREKLCNLSSGERQKVAIASAMVTKTKVLVFDEPSSNLDEIGIKNFKKLLIQLKLNGTTMIFAEHRIYYLIDIVDRFIYIENGKITKEISPKEIKKINIYEQNKLGIRCPNKTIIKPLIKVLKQQDGEPLLELKKISLNIKGKSIIRDCSLLGYSGHIIAVIGANGIGKTSLAKIICGIYKESSGKILIKNKAIGYRKRNKRVWYSANETATQFFTNSLEKEVLIGMKKTPDELSEARRLLKQFNLYDIRNRHPYSLSGGQKQRLSIVCGLLSKRDILILDEPSSGLDYKNMITMAKSIKAAAQLGKIIFLITHDYELVNACCTHYYNISE